MGLEAGIWASRLGFEGGGMKEKEEKEKEEKEEKEIVTSVTYIAGLGPAKNSMS